MTDEAAAIGADYAQALASYVAGPSEAGLMQAATIGRRALARKMGVLDMAAIHHAGLEPLARAATSTSLEAASVFFCEALSPFEMTHRGFQEVTATINDVLRFAAVVCHELRTPLTSLMTSVGILSEVVRAGPGSTEEALMANISRSLVILKERTDDLLDLVGFQSGTLALRPTRIDPGALLAEVVARTAKVKPDVEVTLSVEGTLPPVTADPIRLEQVVSNLVQNALLYGADGRRIDVRGRTEAGRLVIEVQDYGSGIGLWERARIWQPDYRRPSRHHGQVPGLGIGLALCRELVTQHHGRITLDSEEGKGSLFRVELPLDGVAVEGRKRS